MFLFSLGCNTGLARDWQNDDLFLFGARSQRLIYFSPRPSFAMIQAGVWFYMLFVPSRGGAHVQIFSAGIYIYIYVYIFPSEPVQKKIEKSSSGHLNQRPEIMICGVLEGTVRRKCIDAPIEGTRPFGAEIDVCRSEHGRTKWTIIVSECGWKTGTTTTSFDLHPGPIYMMDKFNLLVYLRAE